tara:strand:- start:3724 stop:4266 length:543 start_codon:yes stop_codon:yes gene_type:complete
MIKYYICTLLTLRRCISVLILLGLSPVCAWAETPLGNFQDWGAFTAREDGKLVCYIGAEPITSRGKYKKRGQTFLLVTHRPKENNKRNRFNVVSLRAGYTYKKASMVKMSIGESTFKLFTTKEWAFAENAKLDERLITAMKRGSTLTVKGVSSRGTKTTDIYSLKGFTAAYKAINKACRA